jgi:hypothetical protein
MLRITVPTASYSGSFVLEGRLTGLWAKELLRVARATNQRSSNIFDLQEVFYVDSEGEEALRWLGGHGARFITESAYGKDLCHRLNLRRISTSPMKDNNENRVESCRRTRLRRAEQAGKLDSFAGADANQHSSGCGE